MSEVVETKEVKPKWRPPAAGKGRPPGVPNKIHTDVKKLAQSFGPDAIRKLAEMGGLIPGVAPARPNSTQAYALDKLLDRAYGKARQRDFFVDAPVGSGGVGMMHRSNGLVELGG